MSRRLAMNAAHTRLQALGVLLLAAAMMVGFAAPAIASAPTRSTARAASAKSADDLAQTAKKAKATARSKAVGAAEAADKETWHPEGVKDDPASGLAHLGLKHTEACTGGFAVEDNPASPNARQCTHGPDEAPAGVDVRDVPTTAELREDAAAAAASSTTTTTSTTGEVPCSGDGQSGKRVQAIYAVAADRTDRYGAVVDLIRGYAFSADQTFNNSAVRDGGTRHLRWVTDGSCRLVVDHVVLSATGDDSLGNTRTELKAMGYTRTDRKYIVFADAAVYCGIAYTVNDTRPDASNAANLGPSFARVDSACWNTAYSIVAHEIAHNLGAVQLTSPHATGGWHCTDEYDRMCYNDGGKAMTYPCAYDQEWIFDCNGDDYFSLNPTPGSWLATHWNMADSQFLDGATPKASVGDTSVIEGSGAATGLTFPVTLTVPAVTTTSVTVATATGTATTGTDFTAVAATRLTFAPGETSKTVTVGVTGDRVAELNETVVLNLSSPVGMSLSDANGTGTILNDDDLPSVYVSDTSIVEGAAGVTNGSVTVSLSKTSLNPVTVTYATANGSATAGSDYTAIPAKSLTFAAGQTSKTVPVSVLGDTVAELAESFSVKLSAPVGAMLGDAVGKVNILGEEGPLTVYVGDPAVLEGATTASLSFPVTLSAPAPAKVTVKAVTANGSATAGVDYTALASTTLTFAPGEISKVVTVNVVGDVVTETNETVLLYLSRAVGAMIGDATGTGTVIEDDGIVPAAPLPSVFVTDTAVLEGSTGPAAGKVTLRLSQASRVPVSVTYATISGTAKAGSDFTPIAATVLTFAPGETSTSVDLSVIGDTAPELAESFSVRLSAPVGAVLGDGAATVSILGEEGPLAIHIGDAGLVEGQTGATAMSVPVTLSAAATSTVTVKVVTANGTAFAGSDYTALATTTLTFLAGETSKIVTVDSLGDTTVEANETLSLNLSAATGAVLADTKGQGTIVDDD